jgi:uncharacterized radical SAM superfamily Fe-S cluster-containing enzyme
MDQVEAGLDAFVRSEGEPEVVMFSGGEPTIHPQIVGFMRMAAEKGVRIVNLNTNGMRLAHDRKFMRDISELPKPPNIYMQFDGFAERTHTEIRGRDLRNAKQKALDHCAEFGLNVTLVAAIERDLNEHEIGPIIEFGVGHPAVTGVFFQPVTHSGRFRSDSDPLNKLTNSEVIDGIAAQLPHWFREDDFVPVPCCSPTCRSATFALYDDEDLIPLPRLVDVEDYLDYVSNRAVPDLEVREALEGLWSAKAAGGSGPVAERLECVACATAMPAELREVAARGFMIVVQDFQDAFTLDVEKLRKCCVSEITPDGRLIPFCAYNSVGYREQVRLALSERNGHGH